MNREIWLRKTLRVLLVSALVTVATAAAAEDGDGWVTTSFTPFQLAITPGYGQIFSAAVPVYGLRLSVLYGIQSEVAGLDVGLFNEAGRLRGIGAGFCNVLQERGTGAQLAVGCNHSEGEFTGLQAAAVVNILNGRLRGLQIALANHAGEGAGAQIGFINHASAMRGLQLGFLNWNSKGLLPVLPLFNYGR